MSAVGTRWLGKWTFPSGREAGADAGRRERTDGFVAKQEGEGASVESVSGPVMVSVIPGVWLVQGAVFVLDGTRVR